MQRAPGTNEARYSVKDSRPQPTKKQLGDMIKQVAGCGERRLGRLRHIDDLQLGELLEPLFSKLIAETRLLRTTEWNRRI